MIKESNEIYCLIEGDKVTKVSYHSFDGAVVYDMPNEELGKLSSMNSRRFKVVEGLPVPVTQEEYDAAEAILKPAKDAEELYQARLAKQMKTCDSNFFSLLMAIKTQAEIGVKATACLTWLDELWTSEVPDSLGNSPHTFSEVRAEAEG